MTYEQLEKELKKNLAEIENIQKQVAAQSSKNNPVNAMYERINYLTDRNSEIEGLLYETRQSKTGGSDIQIEKALSITSGGGGVSIRPSEETTEDPSKKIFIQAGQKIVAVKAD